MNPEGRDNIGLGKGEAQNEVIRISSEAAHRYEVTGEVE
jgi:hypothetical protein